MPDKIIPGDPYPQAGGEAFPVGAVFISVVSTSPATLLGYGTWVVFAAGKVLVGLNSSDTDFDTVEETGGAKTVAAAGSNTGGAVNSHAGTAVADHAAGVTGANSGAAVKIGTSSSSAAPSGHTHTTPALTHVVTQPNDHSFTQPTFTGSPTSVIQPYIVVYMWKRTA